MALTVDGQASTLISMSLDVDEPQRAKGNAKFLVSVGQRLQFVFASEGYTAAQFNWPQGNTAV